MTIEDIKSYHDTYEKIVNEMGIEFSWTLEDTRKFLTDPWDDDSWGE